MEKNDWNPEKYLQFDKERLQPNIDLTMRIPHNNPKTIIDIGCGPGNSTQVLQSRWPNAVTTGLDSSAAMIEKASKDYPNQRWVNAEAGTVELDEKFDIVFSNSTIQWIPDHPKLLQWFHDILRPGGCIAVQIPDFINMPLGSSIDRISKSSYWKHLLGSISDIFTMHTTNEYYDMLSELFTSIELWETKFVHIFPSQKQVFDMIHSTGLRPYLQKIESDSERLKFEQEVFESIKEDYPIQKNGAVLFPFYRIFFTGIKR